MVSTRTRVRFKIANQFISYRRYTHRYNPIQNVLLDYFRFKNEVKELCNIVEQLLNDALSITCNIEDALNVLQSLHYFSNWSQLNSHFQKKTNDVYAMLIDDISLAMQFYTDNSYQIPSFMAQYSGVCITAMTEYKRIETLKNVSCNLCL